MAIVGLLDAVDGAYVRVIESRKNLRFASETGEAIGIGDERFREYPSRRRHASDAYRAPGRRLPSLRVRCVHGRDRNRGEDQVGGRPPRLSSVTIIGPARCGSSAVLVGVPTISGRRERNRSGAPCAEGRPPWSHWRIVQSGTCSSADRDLPWREQGTVTGLPGRVRVPAQPPPAAHGRLSKPCSVSGADGRRRPLIGFEGRGTCRSAKRNMSGSAETTG